MSRSEKNADPSWSEYRALVEQIEDYGMCALDALGRVLTWNRGAQRIHDYEPEQIIGRHFSLLYPPGAQTQKQAEHELEAARAAGHVEVEGWRTRRDGEQFWASVSLTLLHDEHGEPRGFASVTRDLTERRQAQEELRQSEERFRLLVDGVADYAIYMLDPEGVVTTWNSGAQKIKGYQASEIIGRNFSLFFTEADRRAGRPRRELGIAEREGRFEEEGWRVRKDGTRFWANVVLTPLRDAGGRLLGFSKVTRDLTARKAAEEATRAARETEAAAREVLATGRMKDEFLATVSHELRTPLNAILGWASLLKGRTDPELIARGLEVVHRNALSQSKLIEDILDVSRVITGKLHMAMKPLDLRPVIQDAIEAVRPSAAARGVQINFESPADAITLVGDAERLQQAMWNLLSNAVKFSRVSGEVRIRLARHGSMLSISVEDDGKGIDPDFLPHVFERFSQADGSSTRRYGGLGLGLGIVRHIVEQHGGRVSAASRGLLQGATFTISLPLRSAARSEREDVPHRSGTSPRATPSGTLAGLRLLVVDDEADARDLVQLLLERAGATVHGADSAAAGLREVEQFRPDVVVCDVAMPDEDGYSFVQQLRALDSELAGTPAIALTAYTRREDARRALATGFSMHLGKPVDQEALLAAVTELAAGDSLPPQRAPPRAASS